jgi:thioredoxin reductase (NADPH)
MSTFPIVIIGAGPAGIATAIEAINRGYKSEDIVIIERFGEIAYMISSKYPDEKPILANYKGRMAACLGDMCITDMTKKEFFDYLNEVIAKYKLKIEFHQQVTQITKLRNGQFNVATTQDTYTCDVVFVAIGNMAAPRNLGVPIDPKISEKIYYDIQNIKAEQKSILVVGGGDSSAEYTKILTERGHSVILSYRGSAFTRMIEQNAKNTQSLVDEKKIHYLPESLIERIDEKDSSSVVYFKDEKYQPLIVSAVVVALGTERPTNYLNSLGISTKTETGEFFSESSMKGLFFVGDLASGKSGGSINFAFNSGVKAVSEACDMHLDCPLPAFRKVG